MNKIISAVNVSKQFGIGAQVVPVLNDVSLTINKGEFVSIMGPSGCGKSTLLYLLGGLDNPSSGDILLKNKNFSSMNDKEKSEVRRNKIGFVFQFYNLVQNLTVKENILLSIIMDGKKVSDYKGKLQEILDIAGELTWSLIPIGAYVFTGNVLFSRKRV